jgi:hypothetical protein
MIFKIPEGGLESKISRGNVGNVVKPMGTMIFKFSEGELEATPAFTIRTRDQK